MITKGEWEVYYGHDNQFADEPLILVRPRENKHEKIIAHLVGDSIEEVQANANLISAAPDMYEALKALIKETRDTDRFSNDIITEALVALNKAEGKVNAKNKVNK